jgi:hypothetical protein
LAIQLLCHDIVEQEDTMKMSYEDIRRINDIRRRLQELKYIGDDSSIQDEKRHWWAEIRAIKDKYETPESRAHKEELRVARENRAFYKRAAISEKKEAKEAVLLKTITPKQIAINKIVDLNYSIRCVWEYAFYLSEKQRERRRKEERKLKSKKAKIMKEFGLKSTDIRRQKKFDKKYA